MYGVLFDYPLYKRIRTKCTANITMYRKLHVLQVVIAGGLFRSEPESI